MAKQQGWERGQGKFAPTVKINVSKADAGNSPGNPTKLNQDKLESQRNVWHRGSYPSAKDAK